MAKNIIDDPKKALILSVEYGCKFPQYLETMKVREKDVSKDKKYQKNFTSYYSVRRDAEWLEEFYSYMQSQKNAKSLNFETILRYLSSIQHSVRKTKKNPSGKATTIEASFSSKMLATFDWSYPIWDSQVTRFLGINVTEDPAMDTISKYINSYKKLKERIDELIKSNEGKKCIDLFDEQFPDYKDINSVKKIDFFLWNLGRKK